MYNYQPALEDNITPQYQRPLFYPDSQYQPKPASDYAPSRDGSGNVQNQEPTGRSRKKSKGSEQSLSRRNFELGDSDGSDENGVVEFFMSRFTMFRNKWLLLDFLLDFITITLLAIFTFGFDRSCPTDYRLEGILLFASYIFFVLTTMPTFFVMNTSKKYKPSACMVFYMITTWIIMTVLLTAWFGFLLIQTYFVELSYTGPAGCGGLFYLIIYWVGIVVIINFVVRVTAFYSRGHCC